LYLQCNLIVFNITSATTFRTIEIYSPGLFGATNYEKYCATSRYDTYAKMQVDAWQNNKFYTNSKTALVSYHYDNKFYDGPYLVSYALAQYDNLMETVYTPNHGIVLYINYEVFWNKDVKWSSPQSNPFM